MCGFQRILTPLLYALILAVGAVLVTGCNTSPSGRIEQVLREDKKVGELMKTLTPEKFTSNEDLEGYRNTIRTCVEAQKKINISKCPADFQQAYIAHIRAWEDLAMVISGHPRMQTGLSGILTGILRGLNGDLTGGALELEGEFKAWGKEVQAAEAKLVQSWRNVEDIAMRHGANLQ
jgi:hypothetical protein